MKPYQQFKWKDDRFWRCKFCEHNEFHITPPKLSPAGNIVFICSLCKVAQTFDCLVPITEEDFWSERHGMYLKETDEEGDEMKPSAIIRKRIEDRFLGPKIAIPISVHPQEWIEEILTFLDQEFERQKAITEELDRKIELLTIFTHTSFI